MTSQINIKTLTAEAVSLLKEMIAIPSPSFKEDAVCSHISQWMSARGMAHERIGNNIVAEHIVDPSLPTLMLCAHIDTVEPCEGYSFDPYIPMSCPEDRVCGLGSNDDGASVVSMIAAYRYLCSGLDRGFQNNPSSSCGAAARCKSPQGCLPIAHDPCGQGGSTVLKTPIQTTESHSNLLLVLTCEEERSGKGGMTGLWGRRICGRNEVREGCTPVDYAIVGEPTGMKAATSERGLLVIDATARGISGHAARNEGRNALYIALEDIDRLRRYEFTKVSPKMGKVNLNVTQINAGSAHNVIPDRCDFVIDIRPTEQYTNEEILAELQSICDSELVPRNLANRSSATYEGSSLQVTAESLGIETFSSATTSDWMRIGCDAIKMGPGESCRSHRKDEFVYVKEIEEGIRTYIEFILGL